ncbi:MAG: SUMF1/EgtB/PvdO family nonheme iron enzyme, partial [Chloroflexi bacterium]|nr:SUMF1/EgtB/PvdO family nonheme iron enzyme [Chloroflexota bacterium]
MLDRLALIIANDEFDDPRLTRLATPGRDAEALAAVLRDPAIGGFDVTPLVNETMLDVRRAIARLYQQRKKGDLLLLYYSGHGIKDDYGDLYLATRNTELDYASATAIDAAFVRGQLDKSHSQRKVVILDCCHSGAFAPGAKSPIGGSAGAQETLAGNGYGRVIITASNALEYAWEGNQLLCKPDDAALSLFTHFLVQGLQTGAADRDGDGQISLDELYGYIYEQVVTSGQARQTPQMSVYEGVGQIIIARNPHWVVKVADLPPELQQAIESPFEGIRAGAVDELARLLRDGDECRTLAARAALEHLVNDDSHRVVEAVARALASAPPQIAPDMLMTITAPIHLELIRIPASEFLMGYGEQLQHSVYVPEFYIGRYPVTNEQYAAFVRANGHAGPEHWRRGGQIPWGRENHPVVNVSWYDACAFCEWLSQQTGRSFRLPTEAEWEKAASWDERTGKKRRYLWGDEFDSGE